MRNTFDRPEGRVRALFVEVRRLLASGLRCAGGCLIGALSIVVSQLIWLGPGRLPVVGSGTVYVLVSALYAGGLAAVLAHIGVRALSWPKWMDSMVGVSVIGASLVVLAGFVVLTLREQAQDGVSLVSALTFSAFLVRGLIPVGATGWFLSREMAMPREAIQAVPDD